MQGSDSPNLLPSAVRQTAVIKKNRPITIVPSGEVISPTSFVTLPPRDDAAEYDDPLDTHNFHDDPRYLHFHNSGLEYLFLIMTNLFNPQTSRIEEKQQGSYLITRTTLCCRREKIKR